jgi:predicted ATPase
VDPVTVARRAIEVSLADRAVVDASARWIFFDRGLIDAAVALEHLIGEPVVKSLGAAHRYNKRMFLVPSELPHDLIISSLTLPRFIPNTRWNTVPPVPPSTAK